MEIQDLPVLPTVFHRVVHVTSDPRSSARDLTEIISKDPSLSARLLRIVNSAYYGFPSKVESLLQAIAILGFVQVRRIIMSISVFHLFSQKRSSLDRRMFWTHSMAVATMASEIAAIHSPADKESAYLAGLLHDFGLLILDQYFKQELEDALMLCRAKRIPLVEAEMAAFGDNHAIMGGHIAKEWNFPPALVEAIQCHHSPWEAENNQKQTQILALANMLVLEAGYPNMKLEHIKADYSLLDPAIAGDEAKRADLLKRLEKLMERESKLLNALFAK